MAGRWHARQDKNVMKSFILTHHGRPLACKNRQKCDEIIYIDMINTPWPATGVQE